MEKLARKQVQQLTPYMSARRIGGTGDVWLNANESPFNNEYKTDFARLNRYSECQPKELISAYAAYALNLTSALVLHKILFYIQISLFVFTFVIFSFVSVKTYFLL